MEKSESEHYPNDQRRAFPRWPVVLEGTCYGSWGTSHCLVNEMSEAGMGLSFERQLRVGDEMTVDWRLENNEEPLHIHCVVRQATAIGTGVAFLNITATERIRVLQFLKKQEAARDLTHN